MELTTCRTDKKTTAPIGAVEKYKVMKYKSIEYPFDEQYKPNYYKNPDEYVTQYENVIPQDEDEQLPDNPTYRYEEQQHYRYQQQNCEKS